MNAVLRFLLGLAALSVPLVLVGWFIVRTVRRAEDPPKMIFKWIVTVPLVLLCTVVAWQIGVVAPFLIVACAVVFSILWTPHIGAWLVKPLTSMFDGGDREIEPKPFYSVARTHHKRGRYREAIAAVRAQLAKFPNDFDGQIMLAEIQAENMNDLQGAEITIQRLCNQKGHPPRSIAFAFNSMADWHLKFGQDREAARQQLEKIIALFPDSELSAMASQRIAHLADTAHLIAPHDRRIISITPGIEDVGLLGVELHPQAPEINPGKQAADYVKHLELHPLDTEAREKLALIYANHFGRLDMAAEQLEQLISHPGQPAKRVVHWLNLLADLQVKHSVGYETVLNTLLRIGELFPETGGAGMAATRIAHLKLELKGKEKSQAVQLGSYEQDIGLKKS